MARSTSTPAAADLTGDRASFASLAVLLWVIAVMAFLGCTLVFVQPFRPVFESLEVELPGLTVLVCDLSEFLNSPLGVLTAVTALALTTVPYFCGARGHRASRCYLWAAVAMFVISIGSYFAVQRPIQMLAQKLGETPPISISLPPR